MQIQGLGMAKDKDFETTRVLRCSVGAHSVVQSQNLCIMEVSLKWSLHSKPKPLNLQTVFFLHLHVC